MLNPALPGRAVHPRADPLPGDDPDLKQSIVDLRDTVLELRRRSHAHAQLGPDDHASRCAAASMISELTSRVALRADRLGMTADALMVIINADINRRARGGRGEPTRSTIRTVMDQVVKARTREVVAHTELTAAQIEMRAATAARVAAEQAYARYAAGSAPGGSGAA